MARLVLPLRDAVGIKQQVCVAVKNACFHREPLPALTYTASHYRPELDGLRAVAVLYVVAFHGSLKIFGYDFFRSGYLGVDVFFVISGYLIGRIILGELLEGRFTFGNFYERRIRRIFPSLFLVLTVSFGLAFFSLTPTPFVDFARSLISALFFCSNIFFWWRTDYFAEPGQLTPLLHTWSLSVEEQFYLVFPLALAVIWAKVPRLTWLILLAGGAISFYFALVSRIPQASAVFYFFHYRAWELLVGVSLAKWEIDFGRNTSSKKAAALSVFGLVLIIFACSALHPRETGLSIANVITVMGAGLVIRFARDDPAARCLASRPAVTLGLLSYSLYLWHQPLLAFARSYFVEDIGTYAIWPLMLSCFVLSFLSWRYVEQPFRRADLISRRIIWMGAIAVCAALFVAATAGLVSEGFPQRYSPEELALLRTNPERGTSIIHGDSCRKPVFIESCRIGAQGIKPDYALIGDSHAETLADSFDKILKRIGHAGYVAVTPGCPFIENVVGPSDCSTAVESIFAALVRYDISKVVINDRVNAYVLGTGFDNREGGIEFAPDLAVRPVGFSGSDHDRIEQLKLLWHQTVRRLRSLDITVYYILPVPEVGWNVPRRMVKLIAQNKLPLTTSYALYLARNQIVYDLVQDYSADKGFVAIYPDKALCDRVSGRCLTHDGHDIFYNDADHLSRSGAAKVIEELAPLLTNR